MQAKRQGRKPSAKPYQQGSSERVVYYRRVPPEKVPVLDGILNGTPPVVAPVVELGLRRDAELTELKAQNYTLADTEERLTKEVADLTAKLDRCARATDDEKARRWMMKYDELKAQIAPSSDYDQTRS
jgi:hypothetical protein